MLEKPSRTSVTSEPVVSELWARLDTADAQQLEATIQAVRDGVTLGEVCDIFREVFGEHRDPAYL